MYLSYRAGAGLDWAADGPVGQTDWAAEPASNWAESAAPAATNNWD
jgi:hypothetical protein